jgi:DNA-binding LacI/PurR family transcriptional regulator
MSVTLKDIAREAGVTHPTVSKVLNNRMSLVSKATREKVLEVVDRLGYQPNFQAQLLKLNKSYHLGVSLPFGMYLLGQTYLTQIIHGLGLAVSDSDYELVLCHNKLTGEQAANLVKQKKQDGVVFVLYRKQILPFLENDLPVLKKNSIPFVVVHATSRMEMPCHNVGLDYYGSGYSLADHLVKQGYETIDYFGYDPSPPDTEMQEGFRAALKDNRREASQARYHVFREQEGLKVNDVLTNLLDSGSLPRAFCCFDDHIALQASAFLRQAGKQVPEDVAIVSGSMQLYQEVADVFSIPLDLTANNFVPSQIGQEAGAMLIDLLEKPENYTTPQSRTMEARLEIRTSCGSHLEKPNN